VPLIRLSFLDVFGHLESWMNLPLIKICSQNFKPFLMLNIFALGLTAIFAYVNHIQVSKITFQKLFDYLNFFLIL
jgi:hypothetical protein